ncbi:hypothetical protein [Desulfobacter hydrogenophilus]
MVTSGAPVSDIKNRLGHQSIESTMTYLQLDLSKKNGKSKICSWNTCNRK